MIGVADADGARVATLTIVANNDVEIGARVEKETSTVTQGDVFAASGIVERAPSPMTVLKPPVVLFVSGEVTDSRVFPALGVGIERIETDGCVASAVPKSPPLLKSARNQ